MCISTATFWSSPFHPSKLLNLFWRERIASFQPILDNLVPHAVLKLSQHLFLGKNDLGIRFWIGSEWLEFQPFGHKSPCKLKAKKEE